MTEINNTNWLQEEAEQNKSQTDFDGETFPALKFEEGKITSFTVDFTEPFRKWDDLTNNTKKAIIPVTSNEEKMVLWLNVKNPLYSELVNKGLAGQTDFKVMQTGNQQNTKYNVVAE